MIRALGQHTHLPRWISGFRAWIRTGVCILSTGPDDFQNLTETFLFKGTLMKVQSVFSRDTRARLFEKPYLIMLKNLSHVPRSGSTSRSLQKFNQFFLVHRYTSGKISIKIRSVVGVNRITYWSQGVALSHWMQGGLVGRKLSLRPSNAWNMTKRKKDMSRFLYHTKDHLA